MREIEPDYSNYSLHDLNHASEHIDQEKYPERSKRLQQEIERRKNQPGYIDPKAELERKREEQERHSTRFLGKKIIYVDRFYYYALTGTLWILLLINLLTLISGTWLAIIPMAVQTMLLINISMKRFEQVTLIKIWCVLVFLPGFFGLVSAGCRALADSLANSSSIHSNAMNPIQSLIYVVIGSYFFLRLEKSIKAEDSVSQGKVPSENAD